jgi:hypothetical protein
MPKAGRRTGKASIPRNFSESLQASFNHLPYRDCRRVPTETSVRFLVLVAGAVAAGAVSVAALQTLFPQHKASMVEAIRATGADLSRFRVSDLNPLRWIYDYEMSQVTSPNRQLNFLSSPPITIGDPIKWTPIGIDQMGLGGANMRPNRGALLGSQYSRSTTARCSRGGVTVPCD